MYDLKFEVALNVCVCLCNSVSIYSLCPPSDQAPGWLPGPGTWILSQLEIAAGHTGHTAGVTDHSHLETWGH